MTYIITIPGNPIPLKRSRVCMRGGFPSHYDSQIEEKNEMTYHMLDNLSYEDMEALKQADYCTISLEYYLPYPSDRKLRRLAVWGLLKPTSPTSGDLSNFLKFNEDVAQGCIIVNDSIITRLKDITKEYSDNPRTVMKVNVHKYPIISERMKMICNLFEPEEIIYIASIANSAKESVLAIQKLTDLNDFDNEEVTKAMQNLVESIGILAQYSPKLTKYTKTLKIKSKHETPNPDPL